MKNLILALFLIFAFTACNTKNAPIEEAKPIQLSEVQKIRVAQDNDFAFDLMKQTLFNATESNVFISPLSVSLALGMTLNGAIGDTRTEMEKALKLSDLSKEEINNYYKLMQTSLPGLDSKTKLSIANSIWYKNTFHANPDFLKINMDYFNSEVAALNFDDPKSVDIINQWCSDKTNGMIPKVLEKIDPLQMMFLINAVYFKGLWVKEFDEKSTHEALFSNELGQKVPVNMMYISDTFGYSEDESAQYLQMPYGNKTFSMTVILPRNTIRAVDFFTNFSRSQFEQAIVKMANEKVDVYFPRFQVKNRLNLIPMLQAMGMKKAFTRGAELDEIGSLKPLFINMIQHDTFVEVTEKGTEAAAVTTVGVGTTSVTQNPHFVADKPFAFVISEKESGIILFMGKIGNVEKF